MNTGFITTEKVINRNTCLFIIDIKRPQKKKKTFIVNILKIISLPLEKRKEKDKQKLKQTQTFSQTQILFEYTYFEPQNRNKRQILLQSPPPLPTPNKTTTIQQPLNQKQKTSKNLKI